MLSLETKNAQVLYVLLGIVAGLFLAFGLALVSWNDAGGGPPVTPDLTPLPNAPVGEQHNGTQPPAPTA